MKSIARTVLAVAILFSVSASAAQGTIGAAVTDAVTISISGMQYSTARWIVLTAGTATVTTEFTIDGVNWKPAAFSQRVDAISANPQNAPWQNTTPVVGSYDAPLAANVSAFRVRCGTIGTSTVVSVIAGQTYTPMERVTATLFDTTSAVNTAIDTGILDTTGWTSLSVFYSTPAGGSGKISQVDDAGSITAINTILIPASAGIVLNLSASAPNCSTVGTSGSAGCSWNWKRTEATSAAVAALTSRVRIEANR